MLAAVVIVALNIPGRGILWGLVALVPTVIVGGFAIFLLWGGILTWTPSNASSESLPHTAWSPSLSSFVQTRIAQNEVIHEPFKAIVSGNTTFLVREAFADYCKYSTDKYDLIVFVTKRPLIRHDQHFGSVVMDLLNMGKSIMYVFVEIDGLREFWAWKNSRSRRGDSDALGRIHGWYIDPRRFLQIPGHVAYFLKTANDGVQLETAFVTATDELGHSYLYSMPAVGELTLYRISIIKLLQAMWREVDSAQPHIDTKERDKMAAALTRMGVRRADVIREGENVVSVDVSLKEDRGVVF